jgi:KUP system potassium uptake protein
MIVTVGLTIAFGKSDNLASAYGIAVSATMLMTSVLLFIAMREIWRWSVPAAGALAGAFLVVDAAFFTANLTKIAEGGYVPLLLASCVYFIMVVWHIGAAAVSKRLQDSVMPIADFMAKIQEGPVPRVPGTAVFLTRTQRDAPPVMVWHLKHNRALHERLFVLTVETESVPRVRGARRLTFHEIAPNFWRACARYGFMQRPDIPALLQQAHAHGCNISLDDVTYYVGHETVVPREDRKGLPRWLETLFAFMQRNSVHVSDFFRLPPEAVVELGRQVSI